ncbi:hypothetical protein QE152_g38850 [Popillia japonica]|uniref:Reverse transcriptase domain-containing protein n=1 Tax=Popillia japonica TaxID=7064 RepID=A0AAW1HVG2_POPJA
MNNPSPWNTRVIHPLRKPNKNPLDNSGWRPVALSSAVGKLLEKVVARCLEWFVETQDMLHIHQWGFIKGQGTAETIAYVVAS